MKEKNLNVQIIKRDNTIEDYNFEKIKTAISKSANRINHKLSDKEIKKLKTLVEIELDGNENVKVEFLHGVVEKVLQYVNKDVAMSYMNYRNYKKEFELNMLNDLERQVNTILNGVDRENSNSNTRYNSTKRTEVAKAFSKELYQKMQLSTEELQALKEGYIYAHDLTDMLIRQYNCCLTDVKSILKGGFELENIFYTEPKRNKTAVGQLGDILQQISGQHFGGNSVSNLDKVLAPYHKMTYDMYYRKFINLGVDEYNAKKEARLEAFDELKQSLQGFEIKLNTIGSSRGSYPFITVSFGDCDNVWEYEVARAILEVRMDGHGKKGFKKRLNFPKLVFLFNEDKYYSDNDDYKGLVDLGIECSSKTMYPDWIGKGHRREGAFITPMGCRAFLSDYRDKNGELVFEGRANLGAISLNLPMIYMKAKMENKDFYETLKYYLEMIRKMHLKRIAYVGKAKASSNPLMFTQGGAYKGYLNPNDEIKPLLKSYTISFGITSLHELCVLHNNKSISEDNKIALDVMKYINEYVDDIKVKDDVLYAIYSSPAESLCGTQLKQFREKYGIIKDVSDKEFFTNSFHCYVGEDITPFEKQDKENELFKLSPGGHINYVRVNPENKKALKKLILRGLKKGFYQGVNFNECVCEDCGNNFTGEHNSECPKCKSLNVTEFNRNCGYKGCSRVKGDTTFNDSKVAEIEARVSM